VKVGISGSTNLWSGASLVVKTLNWVVIGSTSESSRTRLQSLCVALISKLVIYVVARSTYYGRAPNVALVEEDWSAVLGIEQMSISRCLGIELLLVSQDVLSGVWWNPY